MIQFYDLPVEPPVPLADRPLVCPLPRPRKYTIGDVEYAPDTVCWLNGKVYLLRRIKISDLEAWKREHGLRLVGGADLGQHGVVTVYANGGEGGNDDRPAV